MRIDNCEQMGLKMPYDCKTQHSPIALALLMASESTPAMFRVASERPNVCSVAAK